MSDETPKGHELEKAIALATGKCVWKRIESRFPDNPDFTPMRALMDASFTAVPNATMDEKECSGTHHDVPRYSTDIAAAMTLGAEATRLGIASRYLFELRNVVPEPDAAVLPLATLDTRTEWAVAHASAHDRATAFLAAWRAKEVT